MTRWHNSALTLFLFVTIAPLALPAGGIKWRPTLDGALEEAKRDGKPVFIAINMDGERANDEMVSLHYKDRNIVRLSGHMVPVFVSRFEHRGGKGPCPRAGTVSCAEHMAAEKAMRKLVFKDTFEGEVVAPQHICLDSEGEIILSVQYRISPGELEWCLATAIKQLDPEFNWTPSGSARAPRRLVMNGVIPQSGEAPSRAPTKEEIDEIMDTLKTTGRGEANESVIRDSIARLILSDDKRAMNFVKSTLNSKYIGGRRSNRLEQLLHSIGRYSPTVYWEMVVPFAGDYRIKVRREAIVALEQLQEEKALKKLMAQWKKEEEVEAKADLIRAIGAVGSASRKGVGMVREQAKKARDDTLRAAAVIAASNLDDRDIVTALVQTSLEDKSPAVRAAAGYTIAVRRDEHLQQDLEQAALLESDPDVKDAMEKSLEVLSGGPTGPLDSILREFVPSDIARDRL